MVWSIYDQAIYQNHNQCNSNQAKTIGVDEFALYIFNYLIYNCEISGLLTTGMFLDFSEYYTPEKYLKQINLKNLCSYFPKIIFINIEDKKTAES